MCKLLRLQLAQEVLRQSYKRDMELLGWVQLGATKVIKELDHISNEEWLRELGLLSLKESGLRGDLISFCKYQKSGGRGWTNASEQKRMQEKFHLNLVTVQWNRLTKEAVESPSLELFKTCLSAILCHVL